MSILPVLFLYQIKTCPKTHPPPDLLNQSPAALLGISQPGGDLFLGLPNILPKSPPHLPVPHRPGVLVFRACIYSSRIPLPTFQFRIDLWFRGHVKILPESFPPTSSYKKISQSDSTFIHCLRTTAITADTSAPTSNKTLI